MCTEQLMGANITAVTRCMKIVPVFLVLLPEVKNNGRAQDPGFSPRMCIYVGETLLCLGSWSTATSQCTGLAGQCLAS